MKKSKEINLLGTKLTLSERTASDVLSFYELVQQSGNEIQGVNLVFQSAIIVEAALKNNKIDINNNIFRKVIRLFGWDKKFNDAVSFNQKLTAKFLLDNLSNQELFGLVKEVYELEGLNFENSDKKKVMEQQ